MDVARILIRTESFTAINSVFKVKINEDEFEIRVVEDWCGPMKWSISSESKVPLASSDDEESEFGDRWHEIPSEGEQEFPSENEQGKGASNVEGGEDFSSKNQSKVELAVNDSLSHVSDSAPPIGSAPRVRGPEKVISRKVVNLSSHSTDDLSKRDVEMDGDAERGHNFFPISPSNRGLKEVGSSRQGSSLGIVPSAGPIDLPSIPKSRSVACVLHSESGVNENVHCHDGGAGSSMVASFRKVRRMEVARAASSNCSVGMSKGQNLSHDSSKSGKGPVWSGGSIGDSGIQTGNNRFWALHQKATAQKVWNSASALGVEGVSPDSVYIDLIAAGEARDQAAKVMREKEKGAS